MTIFKKTILTCLIFLFCLFPVMNMNVYAADESVPTVTINNGKVSLYNSNVDSADKAKSTIISRYKGLVTFFGGLATISMVAIFIKHFIELGAKASNPMERHQITSGLIWSGLAAACLGSVTFLFSVIYGVFK